MDEPLTTPALTAEELARQKAEYKLITESLFIDEEDTKSVRLFAIIGAIAGCANFIILILFAFLKK